MKCNVSKGKVMKAVLIITSSVDVTVDYIIKRYQNEARFYRLNFISDF